MPLLDIVLGYDCNLACTYCTISPEMRLRAMPTARVAAVIEQAATQGYDEVAFTGGEPTIRPDLPALIKHAKRRGYRHVKVASNGLRYADPKYLDHLLACGVDRFHVSMHARSDEAYDRTVRRVGAAALRRDAIARLRERAIDLVADLIVKRDTHEELAGWIHDLHEQGVRRFALWLVSLTDQNAPNVEQLPPIPEVVPSLIRAFEAGRRGGFEVHSLHVPRCFVPGYEDHVRHPGADQVAVLTPDGYFELSGSRLSGGVKPAVCATCRWNDRCPGLRADYVEHHGDGEVRPMGAP